MTHTSIIKRSAVLLLALTFAGPLAAQIQAFIQIEVDGQVITLGETTFFSTGPDFVEIDSYSLGLVNETQTTGGLPTGRLEVRPIEFVKAITPSSVLLRRALAERRVVEAEIRMYETSSNAVELYRVNAVNAVLTRISPYYGSGSSGEVFYESVALLPSAISFLHVPSGTVYDLQSNPAP